MDLKSVIEYKEYGKISFRLKDVMEEKGINRNTLSKRTNVRFEVIDKWYTGTVSRMDLDVLARICFALDCSVDKIIVYVRDESMEDKE